MFLKKIFAEGTREKAVLGSVNSHIRLLCTACGYFVSAMENRDSNLMQRVVELEREGDTIRRQVISDIYQGAFLPYLRPDLCRFVEMVDRVFDLLEDTANYYLDAKIPDRIEKECIRVAFLNRRICEMLLISFKAMLKGEDLREKSLAIRLYEKKIDDLKFGLLKAVRECPVANFWEGEILSHFIQGLTSISDLIEDAGDYLQIIAVSMK